MLARIRGTDEGISPTMAVGFADMVGFTLLSQHLGHEELAAVVSRFEEVAHDTVVALGGRVVKMIGDEAMFVVQTATMAAEIGLSLSEAYAGDEVLSDVRVGLAIGPVLVQDGDYYGPVVNLASRLVGVANPGTVLVSGEFRAALGADEDHGFETMALRPRTLKDMGLIQPWKLSRAGSEPGADRRRSVRWERLGEILHELEELRDRGEQVVRGASPPVGRRPEASDPVEPDGGDAVAPEVELPFEGGDGIVPVGRPASPTGRGTRPRSASVRGLNTRTSIRPASRRTADTSAPRTTSSVPRAGRLTPSERPGGDQGDQDVVGQPVRIDIADGDGVADGHRTEHLGPFQRDHRPGRHRAGGHAHPGEHAGRPQQGEGQRRGLGARPARRQNARDRPARTRGVPRGRRSGHRSTRTGGTGKVGVPNSSGRPSATRPRSTTVKAHSACDVDEGSGRGRRTRTRWSRDGLSKRVVTRTTDSSARTSRVVSTAT